MSRLSKFSRVTSTDYVGIKQNMLTQEINSQTGTSYTLTDADHGKTVRITNAAVITLSVNTGLRSDFACIIEQGGAGVIEIGGTATLNNVDGKYRTNGQYAEVAISSRGSDTYTVSGSLQHFSPASIPTIAYYDPSDLKTITLADNFVRRMNDKSGNGYNMFAYSGERPSLDRKINYVTVADFDGSDNFYYDNFPVPSSGNIMITFVAAIDTINNSADALMSMDSTDNDWQFVSANATQFDGKLAASGIGSDISITGGPYTGPNIFCLYFDFDGGNYGIYVDGTDVGSASYNTKLNTPQAFRLFANRSDAQFPEGALGEVVVTEATDTDTRQKLEGYFAWRYNLVDQLPGGHPYETDGSLFGY